MGDPFKLIIEDDEGKRNVVPVDLGEVSVGRLETNAIRLNERNVSRNHMRLTKDNGNVVAEDLNSYNGVFINGSRITQRQMIHEGDLIRVGDFHLELRGEGLARRAEETTQKTLVPDLDSTQPGNRPSPKPQTEKIPQPSAEEPVDDEPTQTSAMVPPQTQPMAPTPVSAPPAQAQAPAPTPVDNEETVPDDEERHEPTAIIRMDQLQELEDAGDKGGVISGEKPKLICVSTSYAGKHFDISTSEAVIGRTSDNDVCVDHRSVSRHHAKVVSAGSGFKIVDLGSANGTLVNGEQYAQLALKSGDLIELGHVKFRFVSPGSSYTLTEEEEAAVRGEAPRATAQVGAAAGGGGGGGLMGAIKANPFGAIGAGAAVIAVIVLLIFVFGTSNGDGPEEEDLPIEVGAEEAVAAIEEVDVPAAEATGPGAKWIERALKAMADRDWKKASRYADKALDKDPDNDSIIDLIDKIEIEQEAAENFETANSAMADEDWEGAFDALAEIPDGSIYASDRDDVTSQVKNAWIAELESQAEDAILDGKEKKARAAITKIEELDPDHDAVARLLDELEEDDEPAEEPAEAPKSAKRGKKKKGSKAQPEEEDEPPPPPPEPKKEEPKKVKPDKPVKASGGDAKSHYKKGIALLQGGQTKQAIDAFNKCVQVDRTFCLCYRALGISHARSGNGPKAARFYRLYLKYCPTAKDAPQVKKLLEAYGL